MYIPKTSEKVKNKTTKFPLKFNSRVVGLCLQATYCHINLGILVSPKGLSLHFYAEYHKFLSFWFSGLKMIFNSLPSWLTFWLNNFG